MKIAQISKMLLVGSIFLAAQNLYAQDTMSTTTPDSMPKAGNTANHVSDADITSNIKANLSKDNTVADAKVNITTNRGVVKIIGHVNTDEEASKIVEIAESTAGVKSVNADHLTAKESKQPLADSFITAKVKGIYMREKLFGEADVAPMSITVETTNGVVYLTGTVQSQEQAKNAVKLAKMINGVKKVESKLEVKAQS